MRMTSLYACHTGYDACCVSSLVKSVVCDAFWTQCESRRRSYNPQAGSSRRCSLVCGQTDVDALPGFSDRCEFRLYDLPHRRRPWRTVALFVCTAFAGKQFDPPTSSSSTVPPSVYDKLTSPSSPARYHQTDHPGSSQRDCYFLRISN